MIPSEQVRAALGSGPSAQARQRQRARFLDEARARPRLRPRELAVGTLAAALGSVLMLFVWQQRTPELLDKPRFEGSAFVFNEASQVYLEPGAQAWVERASGHEAVVVLESGELTVSITSGRKNLWRFRAGQNEVIVRGTKFSMLWKPKSEALEVLVREGKVEVHTADGQLRYVTPGEPLAFKPQTPETERGLVFPEVDVADEPVVEEQAAPPAPKKVAPAAAPAKAPATVFPPEMVEASERRPLVPEWKRQAEAGHYPKAVALVEEQSFDAAMVGVSSDDLLLFADAARLARRSDLGRTALTTLRQRYPTTADAAEAAFRLGRLEFDAQRLSEAGTWFDAYVREAPEGPFATEAMGRRLDAWQHAHDARAVGAARAYLERYPKGAYAPLAKKVLEGAPSPH
jgi:TolA-binding protein